MHVQVQKWGNGLALRIPEPIAEKIKISEGTFVGLRATEGKLVATLTKRKKVTLSQLLSKVTKSNLHDEVDPGPSGGRESWQWRVGAPS